MSMSRPLATETARALAFYVYVRTQPAVLARPLSSNARPQVSDAMTRDFPPASFDVAYSRDMMLHVSSVASPCFWSRVA
jgi:hypothetical protein